MGRELTGRFIVFEGVEGAGKTTQIRAIADWLQASLPSEVPIFVTREPGGTALGQEIRKMLLEEDSPDIIAELLLYAADRAQHVAAVLKPHLEKGSIILCDRYTDSTVAYQGYGRGIDLNLIAQLNGIATGGLRSDLTFWLDVNAAVGLDRVRERGAFDRIEQADLSFHQNVQRGFSQLAKAHPQRIVRIDGNRSRDRVQQDIQEILTQRLGLEFQEIDEPLG
nr:dTMP kinase [Lusitaniella coriacea]